MVGAIIMYVAATWEPLRRAIAALQQPPPAHPAPRPAPVAVPQAGEPGRDDAQQPGGGRPAGGGGPQAAVQQAQQRLAPCLVVS